MADYISRHATGIVVDNMLDRAQAAYDEKHTHDNACALSKFGEADGQPTFEGLPIRCEPDEGIPSGGKAGQLLVKNSDNDYDCKWINPNELFGENSASLGRAFLGIAYLGA